MIPVTAQAKINKRDLEDKLILGAIKFVLHLGMLFIMNDGISGLCLLILCIMLLAKLALVYGE